VRRLRGLEVAVGALALLAPQSAQAGYADRVLSTPGLSAYWRLGEAGGTAAADATGGAAGTYLGAPGLGTRGALSGDANPAVAFDGVDDELRAGGAPLAGTGTVEGWFFWEAGVALMRDATSSGGWILAFDSGGRLAYRAGGTTFTTALATTDVRRGWHHLALTVTGGATSLYVDGALVHAGTGAGAGAAAMPWRVMRNGTLDGQFTRGRADEVAVYAAALPATTVREHFEAGRDTSDTAAPAAPVGLVAKARLGHVELDWGESPEPDLDGYDVFRATNAAGPFAQVNPARLRASAFTDATVRGGTTYVYAVTASDVANKQSPFSAPASATPAAAEDLLRRYAPQLRYETQETFFADSAAEMTDGFVAGARQSFLVGAGGTRLAAADPADPLADLSLAFLGDPAYADGRPAGAADFLDAPNRTYRQDAQRLRAAGYGDRVYGRAVATGQRTWLQYWLFSYYNPQHVLGFGVHEGDWEFAQVGLDPGGAPEVAAYGQHDGGERCPWSRVQRTPEGAPVVYVALASHASYFASGVNGRGLLPDDNHRGGGYRVRPALEVVTPSTPFMAWRGRWGGSRSSPAAPRRQGKWGDPDGFSANADACSVGTAQLRATEDAEEAAEVPAPEIDVALTGTRARVRYRFAALSEGAGRPRTLLVSATRAGAPDDVTARRVRVTGREGVVSLRLPPAVGARYAVRASAFAGRGSRSRVVLAVLR